MRQRSQAIAARMMAVMGLGAPLVACGADRPVGKDMTTSSEVIGPTRGAGSGSGSGSGAGADAVAPKVAPLGPLQAELDWDGTGITCAPRPQDQPACPPTAILVNSHGQRESPLRNTLGGGMDQCCYGPAAPGFHWRGRALRGPGGVALADAIARRDWTPQDDEAIAIAIAHMTQQTRAALAEVWLRDAAFEHASVASFARLSLDLIALGAPAALVRDAHLAALDEIAHAEIAYGIAGRLRGESIGPAPLAVDASPTTTLAELARDCFRDGCCGETVAVMLAHAAADATADAGTDEVLRRAYERIAIDEQRHAELAFRIIAWAVRTCESAASTIAAERQRLAASVHDEQGRGAVAAGDVALPGYGVLAEDAERRVRDHAVQAIVLPCIDNLLASESRTRCT